MHGRVAGNLRNVRTAATLLRQEIVTCLSKGHAVLFSYLTQAVSAHFVCITYGHPKRIMILAKYELVC
jgi:hypothetical protein